MLLKQFKIIPFLIGIGVGFVIFYFVKQEKVIIYDYPHPDNVKQRVYRDKNGVCYAYTSVEVDCDKNEGTLKEYPVQG